MSSGLAHRAGWEASFPAFLSRQLVKTVPPLPTDTTFDGQTAIVTGSNAGLGLECARQLCSLHLSRLIVAVRSQAKGDAATESLRRDFPNTTIEVWLVDMEDYQSILSFTKRCNGQERLDMVILNAGAMFFNYQRADTGYEMTLQVNYISTMLLAMLLIPVLKDKKRGEAGHLCFVGSDTAHWMKWDDQHCTSILESASAAGKDANTYYMQAKTFVLMAAQKIAEQTASNDVIVNVANPGLCVGTEFTSSMPESVFKKFWAFFKRSVGRPLEVGARQYVRAVASGSDTHGSFLSEGENAPFPALMYTDEGKAMQEMLWRETLEELKFANLSFF